MVNGISGDKTNRTRAEMPILDTIRLIMESSTTAARWHNALRSISSLIDAPLVEVYSHDFESKHGEIELTTTNDNGTARHYRDIFAVQNTLFLTEQNFQLAGQIWHRHELVSDHDFFASRFYSEFLAPRAMHHILLGTMRNDHRRAQILVAARPETMPEFSSAESDELGLLGPYLEHALTVSARLTQSHQTLGAALTALDHMRHGVIILDLDGRKVRASNKRAEQALASTDFFIDDFGRLNLGPGLNGQEFDETLAQIEANWGQEDMPIDVGLKLGGTAGLPPSHLIIFPLSPEPTASDRLAPEKIEKSVLLIIVDPHVGIQIDPAQLRSVYSMTPAESNLCVLLVQGSTLDAAASSLGITYNTARTHLKQIMAKTETERQADIIRVILSGPAPIRRFAKTY